MSFLRLFRTINNEESNVSVSAVDDIAESSITQQKKDKSAFAVIHFLSEPTILHFILTF